MRDIELSGVAHIGEPVVFEPRVDCGEIVYQKPTDKKQYDTMIMGEWVVK
jgi:hypothetical protein